MKKIILVISIILGLCSVSTAEDKNIGFLMNQKYVCINIGALVDGKLQPILSREESLKYPIRIKIDEWNKLQTDGPMKDLEYLKKDGLGIHYKNNEAQIMLNVENDIRYMLLKNLTVKKIPVILHKCVETDGWTIAKPKEINTKNKQVQEKKSITRDIKHSSSVKYDFFTIRGNGEECSGIYDINNNLHKTTCLKLINSKGIKILCTRHKKMCKTESELLASINHKSSYFITEKGTRFGVTYNKHGAILKSKSFTIYLGKNCDVSSPNFGAGIWRDGRHMGFSIQFKNKEIVFPKQQIYIKGKTECI